MLSPTEDQQIVRDSAARLVREATAAYSSQARDVPQQVWTSITEMGWLALAFAEADGGLGGTVADVCALGLELGRGLMVGSLTTNTILAGRLVAASPAGALRSSLLESILAGARDLAVADVEPRSPGGCADLRTQASPTGDGWSLSGAKTNIWASAETSRVLVSAGCGPDGELLAVVNLGASGLRVREFSTVDAGRALECTFAHVRVPASAVLVPCESNVRAIRAAAWDLASIVMVAECVGMMKSLIERTAEHLRTRKQFGKPLAAFQVLRHRTADMALLSRRAEVLGDRVARQFATLEAGERSRLVAAACVKGLAGLRFVAEQAIQLHGGMGMTAELPIGRYLRRSIALEATFGSPEHHRARFRESAA
jgi:alkylation response protein AidB-like acyl-CoA dehydrogenase